MADLSNIPWNEFPKDAQPDDRVVNNFRFAELTKSEVAARLLIDNSFRNPEEAQSAAFLCRNVLQPIRGELGPFTLNSLFRCQDLERALKKKPKNWVSQSQHTKGQACDIEIPGLSTMDLAKWVSENLEFDQLICECFNPAKGPNSGWVHISLVPPERGENRRQILSYVFDAREGKYIFVEGLKASP